jgi:hypothetical protein
VPKLDEATALCSERSLPKTGGTSRPEHAPNFACESTQKGFAQLFIILLQGGPSNLDRTACGVELELAKLPEQR